MLAASAAGCSGAMYGPPFRPPIPAEAISTRSKDAYPAEPQGRARILAAVGLRVRQALGRRTRSPRSSTPPTRRPPAAGGTRRPCRPRTSRCSTTHSCAVVRRDLARRAAAEAGPESAGRDPPRL